MEEKSDFMDIVKYAIYIIAVILFVDTFIVPGFISSIFGIFGARKKSDGCGCNKGVSSMPELQQQNAKADQLKPQLKACLALEICGEDEVKMPVSSGKVREWKMQVMKNADKIFSKAAAGKGKSKK